MPDFQDLGAVGCAFVDAIPDFAETIDSDEGALQGRLRCGDVLYCDGRRTVMRGLTLELLIELPAAGGVQSLRVDSSDEHVMALDGFEPRFDGCDGVHYARGSVTFREAGKAALVFATQGGELGRFTWTASDAASVEIDVDAGEEDLPRADSYTLEGLLTLRALVLDAEGAQLLAGGREEWWVEDPDVAGLYPSGDLASARGHGILLAPVGEGTTRVHLLVSNLRTAIDVVVPEGTPAFGEAEESP